MNVAYILNSTLPSSGATKSFMNMLKGLMAKGINPIVIVPDKDGIYQELVSMQIPTYVVTFRMHTFPDARSLSGYLLWPFRLVARIVANKRAATKITKFLSDKKIDIIHSNVSLLTIGYQAAKHFHKPHVFHIREVVSVDKFTENRVFQYGYQRIMLVEALRISNFIAPQPVFIDVLNLL